MGWFGTKKKDCCNIEIKEVVETKEESQMNKEDRTEHCCTTSEEKECCPADEN